MSSQQVILPNGNKARLVATHTLTDAKSPSAKVVPVAQKKAVIFFIGGAADQEKYYFQGAFRNIDDAKILLDKKIGSAPSLTKKYLSYAKSYKHAKGKSDIKTNVIDNIPTKSSPIYIIGHSLGGWNGAHLSRILSEEGYSVKYLVTLDPVGEGALVWLGSDIYYSEPSPIAENWINILAAPSHPDQSDSVAEFGERWIINTGPTINVSVDLNHAYAGKMFSQAVQGQSSSCDLIFESINKEFAE